MEYRGGRGKAPARGVFFEAMRARCPTAGMARPSRVCVFMVATAKQPVRDSDLVVSLYQMECGVAVTLRRRVPHGDGFSVVRYAFS